jgi:DNA-binding NarL/FixJ family response regulator
MSEPTTTADPVRVLLCDDEALIRTSLRALLRANPGFEVVAEAHDGHSAVELARTHRPHVTVMDIRMPSLDGIQATRRVVRDGTRVLVLTTYDLDEYVYGALRAGASGFLLKDARPEDLLHALRVVASGEALLAPTAMRRLIHAVAARQPPPEPPIGLHRLTDRERDIFDMIARGLSNAEISDALFLSRGTVRNAVSVILHKLGLVDRVQAVILAYESGLRTPRSVGWNRTRSLTERRRGHRS